MGSEYLLMSIAVVVIGGTAVAGGDSTVPGIWGASLFMFLVVSMLNIYGLGAGVHLIMTGVIIFTVILLASGRKVGAHQDRAFRHDQPGTSSDRRPGLFAVDRGVGGA